MSIFAVEYHYDASKKAAMDLLRPQHRDFLGILHKQGIVKLVGPFLNTSAPGALVIIEAASPLEALKVLDDDPFYQEGCIMQRQVKEWNIVIGQI